MPALVAASEEANRLGAPLTVVHVLDSALASVGAVAGAPFGVVAAQPSAELQAEVRSAAVSTLQQALAGIGAQGEALTLEGSPASTIVEHARERDVSLVVVGTRGRTGFSRLVLGSVAEKVVADAHCSVLAVRMAERP
jgi:universal stress protein A